MNDFIDDLIRDFYPLSERDKDIFQRGVETGFEMAKVAMTARLVHDPLRDLLAENSQSIRSTLHLEV